MNWRINKVVLFSLIVGLLSTSCEDYFEFKTKDILLEEDAYNDRATIYAGMTGLAAAFRSVAEEHIIASELMGDLMQPTNTAPDEYWNLYRYKYDDLRAQNSVIASPARYYRVILNANDYLRHVIRYNETYPDAIPANVYRGLVSTAISYRVWAYLQIGKLYGEAYYYDMTLISGRDAQIGKLLGFDELMQELIYNMRVGVDNVNAFQKLEWRTIINPEIEASNFNQIWNRVSIEPEMLLTELYLWTGDYINAAQTGINFIARPGSADEFKLSQELFGLWAIFQDPTVGTGASRIQNEAITLIPYNFNDRQTHTMQYYFSNVSPGQYYFRPTVNGMLRFMNQIREVEIDEETGKYVFSRGSDFRNNVTFGSFGSFFSGGEAVISKYDWSTTKNQDDSYIYIYRASELHLMIAEALNGLGNNAAADSILNVGLRTSWNGASSFFEVPFESPIYAATLSGTRGVRGRAAMEPDYVRYHLDSTQLVTEEDFKVRKQFVLDSLLAEETALELAYEGKRWFALMRMARNSGRPELLADMVSRKFGEEQEIYKRWLMKPENWFIRWDQAEVANNSETIVP